MILYKCQLDSELFFQILDFLTHEAGHPCILKSSSHFIFVLNDSKNFVELKSPKAPYMLFLKSLYNFVFVFK